MQWKWFFWGLSSFSWQRGTLQLIAIHLITLHNILEYMQIAIIKTEAADFVKMYICVTQNFWPRLYSNRVFLLRYFPPLFLSVSKFTWLLLTVRQILFTSPITTHEEDRASCTHHSPSSSSSAEIALPIPVPPPVTIATLLLNKPGLKTLEAAIIVSDTAVEEWA